MIIPFFISRPGFCIVFKQTRFRLLDIFSKKGLWGDYFMVTNVDFVRKLIKVLVLSKVFEYV